MIRPIFFGCATWSHTLLIWHYLTHIIGMDSPTHFRIHIRADVYRRKKGTPPADVPLICSLGKRYFTSVTRRTDMAKLRLFIWLEPTLPSEKNKLKAVMLPSGDADR